MHINNKSTNKTTLNLTIKLHAQHKITAWTTCTYKSHTDTWKCHEYNDSSSTYRIEVWWGVTSHCGCLVDVDRTAPTAVTGRFLKGVPELSSLNPFLPARFHMLLSTVMKIFISRKSGSYKRPLKTPGWLVAEKEHNSSQSAPFKCGE